MTCVKCNKAFSCGCQKTKASDGAIVHKKQKRTQLKNKDGHCLN